MMNDKHILQAIVYILEDYNDECIPRVEYQIPQIGNCADKLFELFKELIKESEHAN